MAPEVHTRFFARVSDSSRIQHHHKNPIINIHQHLPTSINIGSSRDSQRFRIAPTLINIHQFRRSPWHSLPFSACVRRPIFQNLPLAFLFYIILHLKSINLLSEFSFHSWSANTCAVLHLGQSTYNLATTEVKLNLFEHIY